MRFLSPARRNQPCPGGGARREGDEAEGVITEASLAGLEDRIRDQLRARRTVYEDSKTTLLKMFK